LERESPQSFLRIIMICDSFRNMSIRNEVTRFKKGQPIVLPPGVPPLPRDVVSVFGFRLIELNGSKVWKAATQMDFRELLSEIGVTESKIVEAIQAKNNSTSSCYLYNNECNGTCDPGAGQCTGLLNGLGTIISCYCSV
jgi:hypothetical protein